MPKTKDPFPDTIYFPITRKHLVAGVRCDADHCPVALAVGELFPAKRVSVDSQEIVVGNVSYRPSLATTRFVHDFDAGVILKPRRLSAKKVTA